MYVSSRQGYNPPVKSTGRGKKYSHFASLKYCNGAETFYTYAPQRGKAGGQMAHTNTYGTDTGKKFQLANVKDVIGDYASYGSANYKFELDSKNNLHVTVYDTKTEYSFLYHAPKTDRHSRKENKFMGETKQTYHFVVTLQELKQRAEK